MSPWQNNPRSVSRTCISEVLSFVWSTSYWERSLLPNLHLAMRTELDRILGDIFTDAAALETATVDLKVSIIFNNLSC